MADPRDSTTARSMVFSSSRTLPGQRWRISASSVSDDNVMRRPVRDAARSIVPFDIGITGAGAFPTPQRPRALWLGVDEGVPGMEAAARAVDGSLVERGWAADGRPFRPHLTLARSDGVPAGGAIAARLMERADELRVRFRVEQVGLFESLTGGGPARYEPLVLVDLAG